MKKFQNKLELDGRGVRALGRAGKGGSRVWGWGFLRSVIASVQ